MPESFNFEQSISVFGNFGKTDFYKTSGRVFDGIVYKVRNDLADLLRSGRNVEIILWSASKLIFSALGFIRRNFQSSP